MSKIDYKQELRHLYKSPTKEVVAIDVPAFNYLMVDGEGDPNTAQAYADAVEALFSLSYTLKFMVKKSDLGIDYAVMPLEGLWWAEDMATFTTDNKSNWLWTMMIMQPLPVTEALVAQATSDLKKKKNPTALDKVRFERFTEGQCAQIMHIGPFSAEAPNIERVHHYIESTGHQLSGKHHEIYLSDIRKAAPAKWKTIIRQPMR